MGYHCPDMNRGGGGCIVIFIDAHHRKVAIFVAATTMTKGGTGESDIDEYRSPRCRWIWGGLREPLAANSSMVVDER